MSRSAALEFSFLVSIPTMIAATAYDLLRTLHPGHHAAAAAIAPLAIDLHGWVILGIGFIVSFIVALAVVEWFLQWVRHHGFVLFALYRIALAIAMLVWGARLSHP
jgi:undecaprenyl-diphosphatase